MTPPHLTQGHNYNQTGTTSNMKLQVPYGRVQIFMLGKLVDFSVKWVDGVPLVH